MTGEGEASVAELLEVVRKLSARVEVLEQENQHLREENKQLRTENSRLRKRIEALERKNKKYVAPTRRGRGKQKPMGGLYTC